MHNIQHMYSLLVVETGSIWYLSLKLQKSACLTRVAMRMLYNESLSKAVIINTGWVMDIESLYLLTP